MHVCVCRYIRTYACTCSCNVYMYVNTNVHAQIHVDVHAHVQVHVHARSAVEVNRFFLSHGWDLCHSRGLFERSGCVCNGKVNR